MRSLLQNAQTFLNNLDLDHFNQLMEQINAQSKQTIDEGLASLAESGLLDFIKGNKA